MSRILFVLAFVVGILSYGFWRELNEYIERAFYKGISLEFALLFGAFTLTQKGKFRLIASGLTAVVVYKMQDEWSGGGADFRLIELFWAVFSFFLALFFEKIEAFVFSFVVQLLNNAKRYFKRNR